MNTRSMLLILMAVFLAGCDLFDGGSGGTAPGVDYQADFYTCGEPPNDVLFTCVVGTGPPRQDCTANGSGTTQTPPITC